jgi:branched-chain amino acid transport system ATP-binding protein
MMTSREAAAPVRPDPCLMADQVSFGYGPLLIIDEVTIQVGLGEVVVILGPNGAGKSTLVKGIMGQLPLAHGRVTLNGDDISHLPRQERMQRGIGYVPQVRDVFSTLSVMENLEMGAYLQTKRALRERVGEVLGLFPQFSAMSHRRAGTLSGGERKLLGFARALMGRPNILILDEPTSNLSPSVAAQTLELIAGTLASSGHAVLMIEQRVEMALEVATWGYVLVQGQVRLDAPVSALRQEENLASLFLTGEGAK